MDVLIIEDEDDLREALLDGLTRAFDGLTVLGAGNVDEAEAAISTHGRPQVMVSDVCLPGRSGIDFLLDLEGRKARIKTILISAHAMEAASRQIDRGAALRFLPKPFELEELVTAVRLALEHEEVPSHTDSFTFVDVLQVLHIGKKTAALRLRQEDRVGHIYMQDGEIVHADCGQFEGIDAFGRLLAWHRPGFKVVKDPPKVPTTIQNSFEFLLMESTRLLDEARKDDTTDDHWDGAVPNGTPLNGDPQPMEDLSMTNLQEMCQELVRDTPEAVASNVVDLRTGMMLAGHFVSNFTTDHFEAVSAAVTNLFRGRETLRVEKLVKAQRGDTGDKHFMEQVHLATTHLDHFVIKIPDREAVLTLVTRNHSNIGMGWSAVRAAAPQAAAMVPS